MDALSMGWYPYRKDCVRWGQCSPRWSSCPRGQDIAGKAQRIRHSEPHRLARTSWVFRQSEVPSYSRWRPYRGAILFSATRGPGIRHRSVARSEGALMSQGQPCWQVVQIVHRYPPGCRVPRDSRGPLKHARPIPAAVFP